MSRSGHLLKADDLRGPDYERGELWDGVFVVREPSGGWAGAVEFRVAALLAQEDVRQAGWAFGASQGFLVARDPDRVLSPDVSFVSRRRLARLPEQGFLVGPPDFAAEVRSPSDSWTATIEKGGIWIGHGALVVWCIDPRARLVVVMRPGTEPEHIRPGGTVSLRPAVDLDADVAALFEGLA